MSFLDNLQRTWPASGIKEEIKEEAFDHKLLSSEFGPESTTYRAASPKVKPREFDIEGIDRDSSDGEELSDSELDKIMAKIRRENIVIVTQNVLCRLK